MSKKCIKSIFGGVFTSVVIYPQSSLLRCIKFFCDDEVNVTKFFHVWGVPCPMPQCLWPGPHTADRSTGPHPVPGPSDWWHISNLMFLLHYLLLVWKKMSDSDFIRLFRINADIFISTKIYFCCIKWREQNLWLI